VRINVDLVEITLLQWKISKFVLLHVMLMVIGYLLL